MIQSVVFDLTLYLYDHLLALSVLEVDMNHGCLDILGYVYHLLEPWDTQSHVFGGNAR